MLYLSKSKKVSALNTTLFETGSGFLSTQAGSAVAGVQKLSCQHRPKLLRHTSPKLLRQLLFVCAEAALVAVKAATASARANLEEIGRASCRERVERWTA